MSLHKPRVTYFLNRDTFEFCMWNFVSGDKAQLDLSTETKFHIQKYNTYRYIGKYNKWMEDGLNLNHVSYRGYRVVYFN